MSETPRDRPWQIMLTGHGLEHIDAGTRQALEQILELFAEVPGLVVHTIAGSLSVTRDFPSDYTAQVDRLLGEIFKDNAAVTGIGFLGSRIRTRRRPMIRIGRPRAKRTRASMKLGRGVKSAREAIAAYRRLAAAPE